MMAIAGVLLVAAGLSIVLGPWAGLVTVGLALTVAAVTVEIPDAK